MEIEIAKAGSLQLEQHKKWKAAHLRLRAAKPKPVAPVVVVPPVFQVVPIDPTRELMDFIIAAVGNVAGLAGNEILSGPVLPEITSARNLAMAICLWRLNLDIKTVADYFEVQKDSIKEARRALGPILIEFSISTKTPLKLTLPLIWAQWQAARTAIYPRIADIERAVCEEWEISTVDLCSARRTTSVVIPRQAAMSIVKKLTPRSLPEIGRKFGERDHTTVLHAVRRFAPVIDAVSAKLSPESTVREWARAVKAELLLTPLAICRRGRRLDGKEA